MISQNTFNTHNAKGKYQHEPSNDIMYNLVERSKTTETYSAFTISLTKTPQTFNLSQFVKFSDIKLYERYDVAEVLRGDFSRLFFDIDCHDNEEFNNTFYKAFDVIKNIVEIIAKDNNLDADKILSGYLETKEDDTKALDDLVNNLADYHFYSGDNAIALGTNQPKAKYISSHIYLRGIYFTRSAIKKLFSNFNSAVKMANSNMPSCLDCSVYVEGQRIFRHPYSGKAIQARGTPILTKFAQEWLSENPDAFVATKTENDKIFISESSECYAHIQNYLKTFVKPIKVSDKKETKEFLENFDEETKEDTDLYSTIKRNIVRHTTQCEWYFNLIKKIQFYIYRNSQEGHNLSDKDIIDYFSQPEFRYTTQTHKRKLLQINSIRSALEIAKQNPLTTSKILRDIVELEHVEPKDLKPLETFKTLVGKYAGVDITTLATLIHNTFIFFTRVDDSKESINFIAFKDTNNQLQIKSYTAFMTFLKTYPIPVRLNKEGIIYKIKLETAFNIYDKFKSRYYDFELCSDDENVLSIFNGFNKPEDGNNPLPESVSKIFDLYATVEDKNNHDDITYTVDNDRKEFLLDWFAWMVQHPENRNKTCLQISAKQGIGKNIITNTLCKMIGDRFTMGNAYIDNIIGTYNGGIDKKLLIVMNEVDTKAKNTDKLKSTITDPTIPINEKYGANYIGKNCANYVIFTNHTDTRTIAENDRRFVYIRTEAEPYPKEFYNDIVNPLNSCLKDDIAEGFVNHLLSRDLTNYNPSLAPDFDKTTLYEDRKDKRSAIYRLVDYVYTKESPKIKCGCLIIPELVNALTCLRRLGESICGFYNVDENKSLEDDLITELNKVELTNAGVIKIIGFNDEDKYATKKCRKNFARDKMVIYVK